MRTHFFFRRAAALFLALAAVFSLGGCTVQQVPKLSPLSVSVLRVGKADAIAILSGSHAMLIDTGEEDDGQEVAEFLEKHAVKFLDAMIITHFDQDHVGGADAVLEQFPVQNIYLPAYEGTHAEYFEFLQAAERVSAPVHRLTEPLTFRFGDAQVLVEPPASYEIPEGSVDFDNNFSLITTITHGQNRLVFMGDAEKPRIREWLAGDSAVPCTFLKVPHHGIYNGALEELFETLHPPVSVICDSRKHPASEKTLTLLRRFCPRILETKDGNILVLSDGVRLDVQQKTKP